ncbi:MAG: RNA methyltransferase [Thalassobaculales bacterium]
MTGETRLVTSPANPAVKLLASLRLRKFREETGLFLAEGARTALEGLAAGAVPAQLAYVPGTADRKAVQTLRRACLAAGGTCLEVTADILARITRKENPQTVVAAYAWRRRSLAELDPAAGDLFVALDRVRDPGNLGTVMRTADAVAAAGLLLIGDTCDPWSVEAVRASMGSVFNLPVFAGSEAEFIALAARWPGQVAGTSPRGSTHYRKFTYRPPVLAVMGNEQAGITQAIADACTAVVSIPIFGRPDSLNLAVATGVFLYGVRESLAAAPQFASFSSSASQ